VVNEQINRHRQLTAKSDVTGGAVDSEVAEDEEDEDQELEEVVEEEDLDGEDNPWITVKKKTSEMAAAKTGVDEASLQEFQKDFKKFWVNQNEEKSAKQRKAERKEDVVRERLEMASTVDDLFSEADQIMKSKLRSKLGGDLEESDSEEEVEAEEESPEVETEALKMNTDANHKPKEDEGKEKKEKSLNPDDFVRASNLSSVIEINPEEDSGDELNLDDDEDDEMSQSQAIAEAFAEDDVVAEFSSEKRALIESEKPKDLDTFLPGWGSWGGEGIKVSKRKRKRFILKAPPAAKRRDENKGNLILNDHKQTSVSKHQMKTVPFPFTSVAAVEANMRLPIGETFMPRTASKKLTRPRVKVSVGEVIEPMAKEELVKRGIVKGGGSL
jgi:U3 small nucleolar RNA-associated protein 14